MEGVPFLWSAYFGSLPWAYFMSELRFKNVGVTTGCLKKVWSFLHPSSLTITPSNIEKQIVGVFLNIQDLFFIMGTDIFKIDAAMAWKFF